MRKTALVFWTFVVVLGFYSTEPAMIDAAPTLFQPPVPPIEPAEPDVLPLFSDNLPEDVVYIKVDEDQLPSYQIVTADPTATVSIEESSSFALPPLDAKAQATLDQKMRSGNSSPQVEVSPSSTGIVDNWQELINDGFETRSTSVIA